MARYSALAIDFDTTGCFLLLHDTRLPPTNTHSRPLNILDESERAMRHQKLKYVKILWTNQTEREATWELESQMHEKYPELFSDGTF
jgi:hypothetical protein